MEGKDVATSGILGAFIQTDYKKGDIRTKMEREMVNLLKEIDPAFYKDFIYKDSCGNKFMYEESNKSIYGTLEV